MALEEGGAKRTCGSHAGLWRSRHLCNGEELWHDPAMAIHVLAVHRDAGGTEPAAGGALAAAYSVAVVCWLLSAGVYIAAKWVSAEMPPWALCFWRVLIAFAILLPIVRGHRADMVALVRARGLELLVIGGTGLAVCQGLIFVGLEHADATTAGIIIALIPILTMILARVILAEPMGRWQVIGSILAFVGIAVIILKGSPAALMGLDFNAGELWIVAGAFCFSLYTVFAGRNSSSTGWRCWCFCSALRWSRRSRSTSMNWRPTNARR